MPSRSSILALITLAAFVDIIAYSIAIPVLPDLSGRLGASPTTIGLLFGSFGVTLVTVSIPMGAAADRVGRRLPLVAGLLVLAASTIQFAFAHSLPNLFAARLVQGAGDATTWIVAFALMADLYPAAERGRATGIVMAGASVALMVGPTIGGWLYEIGGPRVPFLAVAAMAVVLAVAFSAIDLPSDRAARDVVPVRAVLRAPAVLACAAAVVAAASTLSMFEPMLALHLRALDVRPALVGLVFGVGAIVSTACHPIVGGLADRLGSRRLTMYGLVASAAAGIALSQAWSLRSAIALFAISGATSAFVITPSLAYMAEATTAAGVESFGVAYGLYNMAWGCGLLAGPAFGGFLFERVGFAALGVLWAPPLLAVAVLLAGVQSSRTSDTKELP